MKQKLLTLMAGVFLLTACSNEKKNDGDKDGGDKKETLSPSKDSEKENTATTPMDTTGMTKKWEAFMTPGPNHEWLTKMNGTWEGEVSNWGFDPSAPPEKQKAVNVQSSVIGGRYVTGKYNSVMMGMPFEGMSTMGYDNAKKMFVSTWIDNMGTGMVHMTGSYDEASKTLNLKGTQTDPMTGKDSDMREEMKMIDDNTYTMSLYGTGMDGKEMKFMEGTFKRRK